MWMFATPVIYPVSRIPEQWRWLLTLNPMTGIVEAFRYAIVPAGEFPVRALSISIVLSLVVFGIGFYWFRRTERVFADLV